MSLRTQYEFLFVGRDEGSFVENYAYDLGEGGENSGKIFINIEIQNNPVDAEVIGETIFDTVRKSFFADPDQDAYVRFEDAVRSVNKALLQMREDKVSKYLGNLHVIIGAIVGKVLYITQTGEAEAYLIRRRLSSTISEGLDETNNVDVFTNIASGTLENGDFILMSSTRLLRYISKNDLSRVCSGHNLVVSLTELKEYLSTEVLGKVGIIGVSVQQTAAELSEAERGQVMEHLEKEEVYEQGAQVRKENSRVQDMILNLSGAVSDLKKKVTSLAGGIKNYQQGPKSRSDVALLDIKNWGRERIIAGIIIILLLLVAGIWWMKARADEQHKIQGYTTMLSEVQEAIGSAVTTGQYNKDQAGEMLKNAEAKALEVLNSGYNRTKANELLLQIQDTKDTLDGVLHPTTRVLADLSQKRQNVSAIGLLALNKTLYAYEYNALYPTALDQVQDPITIDDNEIVVGGTVYDDANSLMFYTKSGKVLEYKDNRVSFVDTSDGGFKKGSAIKAYSNKLYVLSPDDNQIYRYVRRRDKFDAAESWNVNADLKGAVSMAIDGNVYVLKGDGTLLKIYSGNEEKDFAMKKLPLNAIEKPTKIFTELDMDQIYILEPSKQRVLIFNKDTRSGDAVFAKQLVFDDIADIRDIYVDKDTNRLYLLDQSKIYEIAL